MKPTYTITGPGKSGLRHCLDGPAATYEDGQQSWYFYGEFHRLDGPAIVFPKGRSQWWVDGQILPLVENYLSKDKIFQYFNLKFGPDQVKLDYEQIKAALKLAWYHKLITEEQEKSIELAYSLL